MSYSESEPCDFCCKASSASEAFVAGTIADHRGRAALAAICAAIVWAPFLAPRMATAQVMDSTMLSKFVDPLPNPLAKT